MLIVNCKSKCGAMLNVWMIVVRKMKITIKTIAQGHKKTPVAAAALHCAFAQKSPVGTEINHTL